MKALSPCETAESRSVFCSSDTPTLSQVLERVLEDESLTATRKRDIRSAFAQIAKLSGANLRTTSALPAHVRTMLAKLPPPLSKQSAKSRANLKSSIAFALRQYGPKHRPLTERMAFSAEWQTALAKIGTAYVRHSLHRIAAYCTAVGISPEAVETSILVGLHDAMEDEAIIKSPRTIVNDTISAWNRCMRTVPGWPQRRLHSPFKKVPYALPLTAFPLSFQADVAKFTRRMEDADILDTEAPARPLRAATVEARVYQIRQLASALVHRKIVKPAEITCLAAILTPERFKEAIRYFLDRNGQKRTQNIHNMARSLRFIAKRYARLSEGDISELGLICDRLNPRTGVQMAARNRERLKQMDDAANVRRFLDFPVDQWRKAKGQSNPFRAAKTMENGLIMALMQCGLRIGTIRQMEYATDLSWGTGSMNKRCLFHIPGSKMKNHRPKDGILTANVSAMAREYIAHYRPRLPGADGPYLFPGETGAMRSASALRIGLTKALRRNAGLIMHPHLVRHAIAKIIVERNPEAYPLVTQLLGHASMTTTLGSYLGTEGNAMAKHLDQILEGARSPTRPRK